MVKFADGPEIETTIQIDASLERVWKLVSDINLSAQFQDEFKGAEWVSDGPALGAEFVGRNERKGYTWETSSWVVAYEPMETFGWAVSDPDSPGSTWTFRLAPEGDGTEVTFHRRLGPGPSGITSIIERQPDREEEIIALRNAEQLENMRSVVEGVKRLAEAGLSDW